MKKSSDNEPSKALTITLYALGFIGVALTLFIQASHHYPNLMEMCGLGGGGCSDVNATPYAKIFGISTAWWGLLAYVSYLFALKFHRIWVLPITSAIMGAELYFFWLMASVIHIWCLFCLIQFSLVTLIFLLTLLWASKLNKFVLPGGLWSVPVVVLFFFTAFAAPVKLAAKSSSPATFTKIVTYEGNRDSKFMVEFFSDYECGHCKKYEPEIAKMVARHPDILFLYRDYIISSHKLSPVASSFTNAVALSKGREAYLKEREDVFKNQERLYDHLEERLPTIEFTPELKRRVEAKVAADMARGEEMNVYSTPTTVISKDGETIQILRGINSYASIARFLENK